MPKKQKRFTSEKDLLKEIDAVEARRIEALQLAEEREAHLAKQPAGGHKNYLRTEAEKAKRRVEQLTNKKIKLGKALAAHRTMLLPMPGNEYNSVVL